MIEVTLKITHPMTQNELDIVHSLLGGNDAPIKGKTEEAAPAKPYKKAKPLAAPEVEVDAEETEDEPAADKLALAVKTATEMVAAGKTAEVKAALANAGAKRVSELKGAAIDAFLEDLNA
jgi:hypothetical protein